MGSFAAGDHPHTRRPASQIEQPCDFDDIGAVADLTVSVQRRRPRRLRDSCVMALVNATFLVGNPTEYSSRRPRT